MPKIQKIDVVVGSKEYSYSPAGNANGVASFMLENGSFSAPSFAVGIRNVNANQTTRKATVTYVDPLVSSAEGCAPCDRGTILARIEVVQSKEASLDERELAYDRLLALLNDSSVRNSVIKNERFWA